MRDNWNTQIVGHRVLLVPYRRKFVLKYHSWMQDQYVLEMTASDSLSLEEEYNMQETWRDDPNSELPFFLIMLSLTTLMDIYIAR